MNASIYLGIAQNSAFLLTMVLIFDIAETRLKGKNHWLHQAAIGLFLGGIGIAIMLSPWRFSESVFFDTRSILIGISGLFFGTIPTIVVMLMTAAYRFYVGGSAAFTGVGVILATGTIALAWRNLRRGNLADITYLELYVFGLILHIVMLAIMLTLPAGAAMPVLRAISLPVMMIYPIATLLLGGFMSSRLRRLQIRSDLQASEQRLRLAIEAANIGFFDRDLRTNQETYSPEWKKQLGYADDEIENDYEQWRSRVHPDDLPAVLKKVEECITKKQPVYEAQYRLRHKDGSYRWILARGSLHCSPDGTPLRLIGCHIDLTDQKKNEEKYRLLTEDMKDVVWILDTETYYFRYVSPSVEKLRGYTVEEILSVPMDDALTETSREYIHKQIAARKAALLSGGATPESYYVDEVEQPCKDGSTVWTEVVTKYYVNKETGHVEIHGVTRDIRERKQAEAAMKATQAELKRLLESADHSRLALLSVAEDHRLAEEQIRKLNAELEQRVHERTAQLQAANQELESFAYSVSHDLRAPLRALDGYSAILLEDYQDKLDQQGKHYLRRIQDASQRMGQLINDLLALSRVTRSEFSRQSVDLTAIAQEISAALLAQPDGHKPVFEITPNMKAQGDPHLLKIVLDNLLNNAYKFTSQNPHPVIRFGQTERSGKKVFYVQDNGVGFDMAYSNKLFAPFQRLHGTNEFPGTGIGLVTVQRIITRHGGRIWPEAAVDQGATFYFTLENS
ncbi:MAG TPA: PAS domain-containing protein [Anaerolineaceae bacterium]